MQEISTLPGRIRFRNHSLYYNKALAKYINIYTDYLSGVRYCTVNPATASILVVYDPLKTNVPALRKNIENAVLSALQNRPEKIRDYDEYYNTLAKRDKAKRSMLLFGLIYLGLKMKNSVYGKFALGANAGVLQAAAAVTIVGGYPLLKGIYKKFSKSLPADSDILLSLAALSFTLMRESSKGVLLLLLKAMNDYIKYSADAECRRLLNQSMNRTSETAWLVTSSGEEILVGTDTLKAGDVLSVHEGELIPVSGKAVGGSALADTLYCCGQPVITRFGKDSRVEEGASILSGSLLIRVEKLPERKSKSLAGVEKMQLHQTVGRYQQRITPFSLGAGAAGYLLSGNVMNALAVLLALTPSGAGTAFSTGMKSYVSLLNKHRIFLRRPETFEKVIRPDYVVFDKTGTLTHGRMNLELIASFDPDCSETELLKICAACESEHYHPISATLKEAAGSPADIPRVDGSILIPSKGVRAVYSHRPVLIGSLEFMRENGINADDRLDMYADCEKRFLTPVLVSIGGNLSGILAFSDTLKEGAVELIRQLKRKWKCRIVLLTGDNPYKAGSIARKLGIDLVHSGCSHEAKAEIIRVYKTSGTVMMVGDGINDADAMREADVSVSFAYSSCDRIKLNSDYILFDDSMRGLSDVISLSRRAYGRINQSLRFSQLYNFLFGGLAFAGTLDAFAAKSVNTINSIAVLLLNKRIEYLEPDRKDEATGGRKKLPGCNR